ncbi:MAG: DUF3021 family protein [Lachnospiraceae bacterium]
MKTVGNYIKWFLYITTGILLVCAFHFTLAGIKTVTVITFWQILLSGFLTTFVTVLLTPKEEDKKTKTYLKYAMHYIVLCIVMNLCGVWFGWISVSPAGILMMAVDVGLVYLLAFLAYYIVDKKQADEINERLHEKYGEEEE